jgi:hypothetical protein
VEVVARPIGFPMAKAVLSPPQTKEFSKNLEYLLRFLGSVL